MIKQMNGWKVLTYERCSVTISKFNPYAIVDYPKNKIVKPILNNSLLFFFKNEKDAREFSRLGDYIVVPCIAYNCRRIKFASCNGGNNKEFWMNKARKKKYLLPIARLNLPKGTWVAESIMCLE